MTCEQVDAPHAPARALDTSRGAGTWTRTTGPAARDLLRSGFPGVLAMSVGARWSRRRGDGRNAHDGAQQYAIGCAKRIRNLAIHHPQDSEPDATSTLETLGALSTLARWVTEASVARGG